MPFLKTLAIIFLVYYFFKYTLRLLAPFILQSFAKKMQQKFNDQFTHHHQIARTRKVILQLKEKKIMLNQKIIM